MLIALMVFVLSGCSRAPMETETRESLSEINRVEYTAAIESSDIQTEVPEQWHIFEYDGVKYDLWELSPLVNGVSEYGHVGKYVIAEGHINPNNSIFAVIDTEKQTIENHFAGTVPTYCNEDVNTIVYAYWGTVQSFDGTNLIEIDLKDGEYISALSYTRDNTCIDVTVESGLNPYVITIDITPFDPESFFGNIPAEWSQKLFWHQISGTNDYIYFCNLRTVNSTVTGYTDDPPKQFSVYQVNSKQRDVIGNIIAEIPSELQYDTVCPVVVYDGEESKECEFIVQLTEGDKIFYVSFDNFDWEEHGDHLTFTYRGILTPERVNTLESRYPENFQKAKKYFKYFTLDDFKNENSGNSIVYEGYTVTYEIPHSYYEDQTFSFHIHLPQVNDDSVYAEKWNLNVKCEYEERFGEYLQNTVYGTNNTFFANVTFETVTTGDVITIYIINTNGILNSGAAGRFYEIYHYDTIQKRFLSTDEFLAYYAEGQFADYTVADIVKFMNDNVFSTDDGGRPYTLTEADVHGVIPSIYGNGKFDVVYTGFVIEGGGFAARVLFSPYPTQTAISTKTGMTANYTYRLIYSEYTNCHDKELYGQPAGYRLAMREYGEGYDVGYSPDCLFTEDIAEKTGGYSGKHYVPIQSNSEDGKMYMVIDHDTNIGHLNTWIPFDTPETAQDYYRGVLNGYFSYDRILDGNYRVRQNIAELVSEVLEAYRNKKDPNELLPASETEYTAFPLENVRDNPTHEEIGEILKNTIVDKNGNIRISVDIGENRVMVLPLRIGMFGDSYQAYFTGVYFGEISENEIHENIVDGD